MSPSFAAGVLASLRASRLAAFSSVRRRRSAAKSSTSGFPSFSPGFSPGFAPARGLRFVGSSSRLLACGLGCCTDAGELSTSSTVTLARRVNRRRLYGSVGCAGIRGSRCITCCVCGFIITSDTRTSDTRRHCSERALSNPAAYPPTQLRLSKPRPKTATVGREPEHPPSAHAISERHQSHSQSQFRFTKIAASDTSHAPRVRYRLVQRHRLLQRLAQAAAAVTVLVETGAEVDAEAHGLRARAQAVGRGAPRAEESLARVA